MPPLKFTAHFSLEPTPGGPFDLWRADPSEEPRNIPDELKGKGYWADFTNAEEFCRNLYDEIGIKHPDYLWVDLDTASPKFPHLVDRLAQVLADGALRMRKSEVYAGIIEQPESEYEWYSIYGWTESRHRVGHRTGYVTAWPPCKADQAPAGVHLCAEDWVSERFKRVVEEHGFRGAEFFWVQDIGRYQAPQWYLTLPQQSIGRGVDHEWFDSRTLTGEAGQSRDPEHRCGVRSFTNAQLRECAGFDDPVKTRFASFFPPGWLTYTFPPRYIRACQPDADFAKAGHHIAVRKRVRDALLAERLVQPREVTPLLTIEEPPPGVEVLDRPEDRNRLRMGDAVLRVARDKEAAAWAAHVAKPKPVRAATMQRSLKLLKALKKAAPELFARGARAEQLSQANERLGGRIPAAWQQVLAVSDGFEFGGEDSFTALGTAALAEAQQSIAGHATAEGSEVPLIALRISENIAGDYHCLDLTQVTAEGECRVLRISHETLDSEGEWPSVAAFLEEILSNPTED